MRLIRNCVGWVAYAMQNIKMESETQIVGSASTQTTTPLEDGPTTLDPATTTAPTPEATEAPALPTEAPALPEQPLMKYEREPPIVDASFDGSTKEGALKALNWCGISKYKARKILRAAGGSEFLKLEILRSVATCFELPTLEVGEKMLKFCYKQVKSKDTKGFEKAAMMRAFAAIVEQCRHLKEEAIITAEKYAPTKTPPPAAPQQTINVGVSLNNFPPVAPIPNRARVGALPSAEVEEERDRAL